MGLIGLIGLIGFRVCRVCKVSRVEAKAKVLPERSLAVLRSIQWRV